MNIKQQNVIRIYIGDPELYKFFADYIKKEKGINMDITEWRPANNTELTESGIDIVGKELPCP